MKRILIAKLWALGDVLLATPLLKALRTEYPDCHISWLVDKQCAGILTGHPLIDEVISVDIGGWRQDWRHGRIVPYIRTARQIRADLLSRRFDIVLNLIAEKWWALCFNVAPVSIGLFPSPKPGLLTRFYTTSVTRDFAMHNSLHYLRAAEALGAKGPFDPAMTLGIMPDDRAAAMQFLSSQPEYRSGIPTVVLHPGTSCISKCWLPGHFAQLCDMLVEDHNVVITGSPSELGLAEEIAGLVAEKRSRPIVATGKLVDLHQTIALIDGASATVTGDTSVAHIAVALGRPVVIIYGSTRPGDNAPLSGIHSIVHVNDLSCSPCYRASCPLTGADHMRCMREITAARVFEECRSVMRGAGEDLQAALQ